MGERKPSKIIKFGLVSRQTPQQEGFRGLRNKHDEGSVLLFRGAISGAVEAGARQMAAFFGSFLDWPFLGTPPLHEKMHAPVCTLLLSFRPLPRAQVVFLCPSDATPRRHVFSRPRGARCTHMWDRSGSFPPHFFLGSLAMATANYSLKYG